MVVATCCGREVMAMPVSFRLAGWLSLDMLGFDWLAGLPVVGWLAMADRGWLWLAFCHDCLCGNGCFCFFLCHLVKVRLILSD